MAQVRSPGRAFSGFQYPTPPLHPSADAEQRIGAMMNARWTSKPPAAAQTSAARKRTAAPASAAPMSEAA